MSSGWAFDAALTWRLTIAALQRFTTQRVLSWAWWILEPLILITVYAIVIGFIRRHPIPDYPLFLACALIPWRWYTVATTRGANALLSNAGLLTATPVNRESVVLSEVAAATIEALLGIPVLLGFMLYYGEEPTRALLWLPLPLIVLAALTSGVSFLLSPVNVLLRDTTNSYAASLRVLWFLSPGLYALREIPESATLPGTSIELPLQTMLIWLNPFTGIIEGVRRPIVDGLPPHWPALLASAIWALVAILVGRRVFRRLADSAIRMF